jgi:phenylpropionate dioxygenase-like ring-hydroxylating dioxygenase large terminal subunit
MNLNSNRLDIDRLVGEYQFGWSLEQSFYTDPTLHDIDTERVFMHHWLCAGHVSRIPHPGDYFTCPVANESIVVIRGDDERIHALFNVCRHRGSRICVHETGHATKLVCPYHQWVYDSDGSLIHARHTPAGFDLSGFDLHRAHCRVAEGLIFINLASKPAEFTSFERDIVPRLRPHNLWRAKVCHRSSYHIRANWKLVVENSRECYHCGAGHPQYCRAVGFAAAIDSHAAADGEGLIGATQHALLEAQGIDGTPVPFSPGSWHHCRRFFLRDNFVTESMDGKPVAPLMGSITNPNVGVLAVVTLPNLLLEVSSDYAILVRLVPVSPQLTRADMEWLVAESAVEGKDYDVNRVTEFWKLTAEQDWKLCEDNQAGVNSTRYQPGPYMPVESGVAHFVDWYRRALASS